MISFDQFSLQFCQYCILSRKCSVLLRSAHVDGYSRIKKVIRQIWTVGFLFDMLLNTPIFHHPHSLLPLSSWYRGLKIFPTLLIKGFFFHFWCCKWYFCKHGPQQTNHCWHLIVSNFKRPLLEKNASGSKRLKYPFKNIYFPRWIQEAVMLKRKKKNISTWVK